MRTLWKWSLQMKDLDTGRTATLGGEFYTERKDATEAQVRRSVLVDLDDKYQMGRIEILSFAAARMN